MKKLENLKKLEKLKLWQGWPKATSFLRARDMVYLLLSVCFFAYVSTYIPLPSSRLNPLPVISIEITDRYGEPLREVLSDAGGRCRWVKLEEVSPYLVKTTIAAEDRDFFTHPGINGSSVLRAAFQNLVRGKIISGASTITQQLARNLWPGPRNLLSKLRETWLALRLEHYLSKKRILEEYLNRIFYGNQAYGAEAAARLYFKKSCAELTLAEAAFLAGLPRSPSLLNPFRPDGGLQAATKRQQFIIKRMTELGLCSQEEANQALNEKLNFNQAEVCFRAPHFCDWLLENIPAEVKRKLKTIQTTLDYRLQTKIEIMLRKHLDLLVSRGVTNGAVIVIESQSGDILSLVGSKDYFDPEEGQVNGAVSRRQPGSTLKPFTYALALEKGLTAASLLEDEARTFPTATGAYMPLNFDLKFHGPVTLRTALACSYNVPAVSLASWVSPEMLLRRLHQLGFKSLEQNPDFYGVGLTLGNGEVTLLELARGYAALARSGVYQPERTILSVTLQKNGNRDGQVYQDLRRFLPPSPLFGLKEDFISGRSHSNDDQKPVLSSRLAAKSSFPEQEKMAPNRVISAPVAYIITDILADRDARVPSFGYLTPLSFPFPVAVKTGTSKDFRDNWTVGFTTQYTVAVWVGNFNGKPMGHVSGVTGSGPLFHDIMLLLHSKEPPPPFSEPEGTVRVVICAETGELPSPFCPHTRQEIFTSGTEPKKICPKHLGRFAASPGLTPKTGFPAKASSCSPEPRALEIVFPQNGDVFFVDPVLRLAHQSLKFRVSVNRKEAPVSQFEWYLNGNKVGQTKRPSLFWNLRPGSYLLEARAVTARESLVSRPVNFRVVANYSNLAGGPSKDSDGIQ